MTLDELKIKIQAKEARLAVIGLGYVGFPVACEFARLGFDVLGVDLRRERVDMINSGQSPIVGNEPGLSELAAEVIGKQRFKAVFDYEQMADRDVIIICVETPVDEHNIPRYTALRSALNELGPVLKDGALVIVESTIAPRTMQDVVLPNLEQATLKRLNQGFYLGNCPERVMPGKLLANIRGVHRVVGGMTPETAQVIALLYRHIVHAEIDQTDCITAEVVKTVENTYRDVQIAFANEVALICEQVGGDVWRVRELVNKSPGRMMLMPGAGVGGHCIPKDPWLLAYSVHKDDVQLRIIPAARSVNDYMPYHMVELIKKGLESIGSQIPRAKILVMGYSYLEDSDDSRNSPSKVLIGYLEDQDADCIIHDPFIEDYQGSLLDKAQGCDAAVLMVGHTEYRKLDLKALSGVMKTPVLIDGRSVFDPATAARAGFTYWGVGVHPEAHEKIQMNEVKPIQ